MNTYGYVGGNPLGFIDPNGLRPLTDLEKAFLTAFFGNCIDANSINLEGRKFGDTDRPYSPNVNEIQLPSSFFLEGNPSNEIDFSSTKAMSKFAHEATHSWQRKQGRNVSWPGFWLQVGHSLKIIDAYAFEDTISDPVLMNNQFNSANVEQQGKMVEVLVAKSITPDGADISPYSEIEKTLKGCGCNK